MQPLFPSRSSHPAPYRIFFVSLVLAWTISLAMPLMVQAESFLEKMFRIMGVGTPARQRGPCEGPVDGDVWIVNMAQTSQKMTWGGGYRSPVFAPGDETIFALKGSDLVHIPVLSGEPEKLYTVKGALKLVGVVSMHDQDKLLILTADKHGRLSVGLLSLQSGKVTTIPHDRESVKVQHIVDHPEEWEWERVYGSITLYVQCEERQDTAGLTRWTDVYITQEGHTPKNLSQCDGAPCGQPSRSHDGNRVVSIAG